MEIRLIGTREECTAILTALTTQYQVTRVRNRPAHRSNPTSIMRRIYADIYPREDS